MSFLQNVNSPLRYLKVKIPLLSALILTLVFTTSSIFLIRGNFEREKSSLLSKARAFSNLATLPIGNSFNNFFEAGYLKFREDIVDIMALNSDVKSIQIIKPDGQIVFNSVDIDSPNTTGKKKIDEQHLKLLNSYKPTEIKNSNGDTDQIIVPFFDDFGAKPFSIKYIISYDSVYSSIKENVITTLSLALFTLVATLLATTYLVYRSILSPLGQIVKAAKEISHDNLTQFLKLNTRDELGELADSLNQMTEKLRKSILDLKRLDKMKDEFIFLASHNLRTPLTIINGYISMLKDSKSLSPDEQHSVTNLEQGAKQLETVTESLLNLVTLEKGQGQFQKNRVSLQEIINNVAKVFQSIAQKENKKIITQFDSRKTAYIEADSTRLSQVFSSLIDNSLKFSKPGSEIFIKLESIGANAVVSIKDQGIGIAQEEQKYLFSKFHRATETLQYDYKGMGLSLYLAKLIVSSHNGKIWFESKLGEGSTFFIQFPLVK